MSENYYLSHGGPGSGRYPLGSGDRPYQKFKGSGSGKGGIRGYIQSRKTKKEELRTQKAQEEKQKHDNDKERILRSGSSKEVMKYKGELTNKELQEAADRLRLERQIESYTQQDKRNALNKVKDILLYTGAAVSTARDGIELWNSFAGIYNATPRGKAKSLTRIIK